MENDTYCKENASMDYRLTAAQLTALVEDVPYPIANLANASALLWENMENINWVGFYQYQDAQLVLGPFQGKPACVQIPMGKGVCGTAAATGRIQLVEDVHTFPGHIACDTATNAEIVLPMYVRGQLWGVLDIDSPDLGRFTQADAEGLSQIMKILEKSLEK